MCTGDTGTHLSLKQPLPICGFSTAFDAVNKSIPFQPSKSLGHSFTLDPFYLHIETTNWVSPQEGSKCLRLWRSEFRLICVSLASGLFLHTEASPVPLCLPQQYRKSFILREELVASKYCENLPHNLERLGQRGGLEVLCLSPVSEKKDGVMCQGQL